MLCAHDVRANNDAKNIRNCPQAEPFSYSIIYDDVPKYTIYWSAVATYATSTRALLIFSHRSNGRVTRTEKLTATSWTESRSSHLCFTEVVGDGVQQPGDHKHHKQLIILSSASTYADDLFLFIFVKFVFSFLIFLIFPFIFERNYMFNFKWKAAPRERRARARHAIHIGLIFSVYFFLCSIRFSFIIPVFFFSPFGITKIQFWSILWLSTVRDGGRSRPRVCVSMECSVRGRNKSESDQK